MAKPTPTEKQIDAYVLVVIRRLTHRKAAEKLGICRSALTRRIKRFFSHIKD